MEKFETMDELRAGVMDWLMEVFVSLGAPLELDPTLGAVRYVDDERVEVGIIAGPESRWVSIPRTLCGGNAPKPLVSASGGTTGIVHDLPDEEAWIAAVTQWRDEVWVRQGRPSNFKPRTVSCKLQPDHSLRVEVSACGESFVARLPVVAFVDDAQGVH